MHCLAFIAISIGPMLKSNMGSLMLGCKATMRVVMAIQATLKFVSFYQTVEESVQSSLKMNLSSVLVMMLL